MALALADRAFKNKFTALSQIYDLIIPSDTDRIRLKWDDTWARRPIFRDVEKTPEKEVHISETKPLQYSKYRHYFVRLGRSCRYRKRLVFYDLRRASRKKLNSRINLSPLI
jgi:hypothetical protein